MKHKNMIFYFYLGIQCLCIFIDFFFLDFESISLSNCINILLTANSILFTITISYVIFLKERYVNRFYTSKADNIDLITLLVLFIMGLVIVIIDDFIWISELIYVIYSLAYIIYYTKNVIVKLKSNEIEHLVHKITEETNNHIENNKKNQINKYLNELNQIYKYEYLNSNVDTCKEIINSYSAFLEKYLEERNKNIIKNGSNNDDNFKKLIFFLKKFLKKDSTDLALNLNNYILIKLSKFTSLLVKFKMNEIIEIILDEYNDIIKDYYKFIEKEESIIYLYKILTQAYLNQNLDLFKMINDKNILILKYISFSKTELLDSYIIYKYFNSILVDLLKKDDEYFDYIFNKFKVIANMHVEKDDIKYFIGCLHNFVKSELFNCENIKEKFFKLIVELINNNKNMFSTDFVKWLFFYLNECINNDYSKIEHIQKLCCFKLLDINKEIPKFLLPDYSLNSLQNVNNDKINEDNISNIKDIMKKCVINKKIFTLGQILNNISITIMKYSQSNKKEQKMWFSLIFNVIADPKVGNDLDMLKTVMVYLEDIIYDMDKEKKISKDLSKYIINNLYLIAEKYMIDNENVTLIAIELLDNFSNRDNNLNFVNSNSEVEDDIYEILFNIGVNSIETNNENILKKISNTLGWKIKEKMEKKQQQIAFSIIDNAVTLYDLCYENRLNQQTIVFVGTLFIIIGAYAETNPNFANYKKRIKDKIGKKEYKELLYRSHMLRRYKTKDWKDLLGKNQQKKLDDFWEYLFNEKNSK